MALSTSLTQVTRAGLSSFQNYEINAVTAVGIAVAVAYAPLTQSRTTVTKSQGGVAPVCFKKYAFFK